MFKIKIDNDLGLTLINDLVCLVKENGGEIHPHLQLAVIKGEMSFSITRKIAPNERILSLPLNCMPTLNDFEYSLISGEFIVAVKQGLDVSQLQRDVMRLCAEIYNVFNKVEGYSKFSPPVQFRNHLALSDVLLTAVNAKQFSFKQFNSIEEQKVFCFLNNRAYYERYSGSNRLIPILEFFDHNAFSGGYIQGYDDAVGRTLDVCYVPAVKGKSVFVAYTVMDALESFVKFGFVDKSAYFAHSQPFVVELPYLGEVLISRQGIGSHQLPLDEWLWEPKYRNSLIYTSKTQYNRNSNHQISYCLIPPKRHMKAFDEALEQHFTYFERAANLAEGSINNKKTLLIFKNKMVKENKNFYSNLIMLARKARLDTSEPVTKMFADVIKQQMEIIIQFEKVIS